MLYTYDYPKIAGDSGQGQTATNAQQYASSVESLKRKVAHVPPIIHKSLK